MRSLRKTLILGTSAGIAAVLVAVGIVLYFAVRADLVSQFDVSLLDKAALLASTVELEEGNIDLQFDEFDLREFEKKENPGYLQIWAPDGSVIYRSASLGEGDLNAGPASGDAQAFFWLKLPGGAPGRAVRLSFLPAVEGALPGGRASQSGNIPNELENKIGRFRLVLARGTFPIDGALARMALLLVLVGAAATVVSCAVLWTVVRRSMNPLERLAAEIRGIGEQNLSEGISGAYKVKELQPVVDRLNELLARLENALQRERSFSADVAHELRTPIAGLRSTMEVVLSRPRESAAYAEALGDSLEIATQMQEMVEKLLTLARLEAGQVDIKPGHLDIKEMLRSAWEGAGADAGKRGLKIRWELQDGVSVFTDKSLLGMVVRNIFENAVTYADEGGSIRVEASPQNGEVCIRVANTGSALSQEQAEHVFQRFWREDSSRSAAAVRCGLGLSLVEKITVLLGGTVKARSSAGGEFEISIRLPKK